MKGLWMWMVVAGVAGVAQGQALVDHHLHLLRSLEQAPAGVALTAADLVKQMDAAGVKRGVVLSVAYRYGNPNRPAVENEYERVKAENDWTREQVGAYRGRLLGFCGVNPLKEYAVEEVRRCAGMKGMGKGLKLHFGNSDVDLENAAHVAQLKRVFGEANRQRMAIVAHIRANYDKRRPWGARQARVFVEELLPVAKDVVVQIAHVAGAGRYDDAGVAEALGYFGEAIARKDRRMKRVYFDVSFMGWEGKEEELARQLRQVGMKRLLLASDGVPGDGLKRARGLPLRGEELRVIEGNVAPYWK